MGALSQALQDPSKRRRIVGDGVTLIETEVSRKTGLSGLAVKAAYKVVKGLKPGIIPAALDQLLDDFALKVDPFYESFKASGEADHRAWFVRKGGEIAEALLAITDERAEHSSHRTLRGAYYKLRTEARKHVMEAMPGVADLMKKNVG
jgi:hypothetical protein